MNAEQLTNLKSLRDLGARILAEPERYPLGFGQFDCGTFACWSGWYGREYGFEPEDAWTSCEELFGIEYSQACELFTLTDRQPDMPGPAAYTELARRLELLDALIAEHEPSPLPRSVRALFERELEPEL